MAEGTVLEFQADLKAFSEAIGVTVADATRRVSLDIHNGVIEKTPVDTGRARASWGVNLDAPGTYEAPEGQYGPEGGTALAKAQQRELDALTGDSPYHEVFIFNNLSYIEILEGGSSTQAPLGFAAITLAEVTSELDAILEAVAQQHLTEQ